MNRHDSAFAEPADNRRRRSRPPFLLLLLVLLFVLVPFFFWHGTWFGRSLSEEETGKYLSETQRPRKTQHALVQIGERILRGDPTVKRWYPEVRTLSAHEAAEIRATVAWVMGQDNQAPEFHAALLDLLHDPDLLVRRNAALSLVRFQDTSGRPEILGMLRPNEVRAPASGTLAIRLREKEAVNPGTLIGRIHGAADKEMEIRALVPGRVERWLVADGERVRAGELLALISPAEQQVWEALRGLYLVGEPEDLPVIQPFVRGVEGMPARIQQQARLTQEAIRQRARESNQVPPSGSMD